MKKITLVLFLIIPFLTGCGTATPSPVTFLLGTEFTLAPDQTATLTDTELTVRLSGVTRDERCPSEIECAASGPVSLSLSAQLGNAEARDINLQVFTSNNGRAPEMHFEGIEDHTVYEGYLIRVVNVLPYPARSFNKIKDSEYRVTVIVSREE